MADIKRPVKIYNGSDWDKFPPMLNDSVALRELNFTEFFGIKLLNDVIYNADAQNIPLGATYANMVNTTEYARITTSSDADGPGWCKILKTGYYFVFGEIRVNDTGTNAAFEVKVVASSAGEIANGSGARAWNLRVAAGCCGIAKLTAGEILRINVVRTYGGGSYKLEVGKTSMRVYPLYIPD
ncbi:hypothetical protein [Eubacterium sp.]|uniref:hypothetical protein n=1 Tax=Eubacterium sp. TaxID=142586 RepID=UPI002FC7DCC0